MFGRARVAIGAGCDLVGRGGGRIDEREDDTVRQLRRSDDGAERRRGREAKSQL